MYKSKLYMTKTIHPLLSHYSPTKWGGGEGGDYSSGALILNFGRLEGRLLEGGAYSRGGGWGGGTLIRGFTVFTGPFSLSLFSMIG